MGLCGTSQEELAFIPPQLYTYPPNHRKQMFE